MTLTQKESTLLQDLKSQEQLCVDKYAKYSSDACDGALKNLFTQLGQTEQQHLDTIGKILGGTVPASASGSSGSSSSGSSASGSAASGSSGKSASMQAGNSSGAGDKQKDKYLCSDALSTEKHVSSIYDTCIFEFRDTAVRNALNHIQKEEQDHGERIYNYMSQNGMYS